MSCLLSINIIHRHHLYSIVQQFYNIEFMPGRMQVHFDLFLFNETEADSDSINKF